MTAQTIEVFQDLYLRGDVPASVMREKILAQVKAPWKHDEKREADLRDGALDGADVIVLVRDPQGGLGRASLALWQEKLGYRIANIVPLETDEFTFEQYNRVLKDFATRIGAPAAMDGGFEIQTTKDALDLEDLADPHVAKLLTVFSNLANKSTGASHPKDRERWFDFVCAARRAPKRPSSDQLARWLHEIERWPSDRAHDLARDYEYSLDLLDHNDQRRG